MVEAWAGSPRFCFGTAFRLVGRGSEDEEEVIDDVTDELSDAVASAIEPLGLEVADLALRPGLVRVVVDRPGGVDLDAIAEATRAVSAVLDRLDPLPGHYTLEVSSPGVERPLRTRRQFDAAVGETVSVRTVAGGEGERRAQGRLAAVDDDGIVVEGGDGPRRIAYDDIDRARTVFEWGTPARPAAGRARAGGGRGGRPPMATGAR